MVSVLLFFIYSHVRIRGHNSSPLTRPFRSFPAHIIAEPEAGGILFHKKLKSTYAALPKKEGCPPSLVPLVKCIQHAMHILFHLMSHNIGKSHFKCIKNSLMPFARVKQDPLQLFRPK